MPDALRCQKEAFQLPPGLHYLNCAYMSPLAHSVEAAVIEGLRTKRVPSKVAPEAFFSAAQKARDRFGRLVSGAPERVAILPAVSYGVAIAARNLPVARGQRVVVLDEQFPGNVYAWRRVVEEAGAELVTVPRPPSASPGAAWNEALLDAIRPEAAIVTGPGAPGSDSSGAGVAGVRAR